MTQHPAIPLTAAIVGTVGGCVLGWCLRGAAGPIRSARKRPVGAVHVARFQAVPELVAAIKEAQVLISSDIREPLIPYHVWDTAARKVD